MAATQDILIKLQANVQEALRLWQEMEKGPERFGDVLDQASKTGKHGATELTHVLDGMLTKWFSVHGAIHLAREALGKFREEIVELQRERFETTETLESGFKGLFLQAGVFRPQDEPARHQMEQAIFRIAEQTRAPNVQYVQTVAKELISMGFPIGELMERGGLQTMLGIAQSTAATRPDIDPRQLTRAIAAFITSTRGEAGLTQENLRRAGVGIQTLFQFTPLETTDLMELAGVAGQVRAFGKLDIEEQLALFSVLRGRLPAAEASTAFRNVVQIMTGARAQGGRSMAALHRMGLSPEDIDAVGETFSEAIGRLRAGVGRLRPEEISPTMQELFGRRAAGGALFAMEGLEEFGRRMEMVRGAGGAFDEAVGFARAGEGGKLRASGVRRQKAMFDESSIAIERIRTDLGTVLAEEPGVNIWERMLIKGLFEFAVSGDVAPERAARTAIRLGAGKGLDTASEIGEWRRLEVRLFDQDGIAIPAKTELHKLEEPAAAR